MKLYWVQITEDAEHDLFEIFSYVALHDSLENASYVLDELQQLCLSVAGRPPRGHVPPESDRVGITGYQ